MFSPVPQHDREARLNDILAVVVAVGVAGFVTFVIWAMFGQP